MSRTARLLLMALSGGGGNPYTWQPTQSLGAELLTNPNMDWSAGSLTGYTLAAGTVGGDPGISEVAAGGGAGTGAVKFTSTATNDSPRITQTVLTVGEWYEVRAVMSARTSGTARFSAGITSGSVGATLGAVAEAKFLLRANSTTLSFASMTAPSNLVMDALSAKLLTQNAEITAPSADGTLTQLFTLPGTPKTGANLLFMPRISNRASGNYWLVLYQYSGSQWELFLMSVASHARTVRINAGSVGVINGVSVLMDGDDWSLYTTDNGGSSWTQRGSTITNSLYNTATGVNVMCDSDITLGALSFLAV